jgi:hypothetical protein
MPSSLKINKNTRQLSSKPEIFIHKKADDKDAEDSAQGPDNDDEPKDQMTMTNPRTR